MGWIGRTKRTPGGGPAIPTIASATQVWLPDDVSIAYISGTTAITTVKPATIIPGRTITFIGVTTTGPAFANNNDTTTQYQMDLGGSNRTIAPQDILCLMQKSDGTWLMLYTTNN
jgi:hypothetical protein